MNQKYADSGISPESDQLSTLQTLSLLIKYLKYNKTIIQEKVK